MCKNCCIKCTVFENLGERQSILSMNSSGSRMSQIAGFGSASGLAVSYRPWRGGMNGVSDELFSTTAGVSS